MIKAILTDIEGTITRISFVKEILFPYAAARLPQFILDHQHDDSVAEQIDAVREELNNPEASIDAVIDVLLEWIATDKKITPLKQLQGLVWQFGYKNGDFTGHLYEDAYQFLTQQKAGGRDLYVYSSGSVKAQQLLFAYSDYGDIRSLFSDYFDTRIGAKQEVSAYQNIVTALPYEAEQILFLSDVVAELDAAKAAGMKTLQLFRDAQAISPEHPVISSFDHFDEGALL
ncbi:acireductone synthase [Pseudoalteromonas piscicida]|uniref:Enolase-phosphatase E1 n=1 Tax=Pseudoalteromonas piscicida TaxID=43662 RepID=A0A2A5JMT9_PSEO7|nr:acireductone synthase [Pseudoalteromonas piscicida]PCK30746.1 acireductone synthase [Pseudoalteromonas piscicida]